MRTCTTMIYTNGATSRYAVLRGKMKGRAFDAHTAETVAVYELTDELPNYSEMTARHATKQAPAVRWQA